MDLTKTSVKQINKFKAEQTIVPAIPPGSLQVGYARAIDRNIKSQSEALDTLLSGLSATDRIEREKRIGRK